MRVKKGAKHLIWPEISMKFKTSRVRGEPLKSRISRFIRGFRGLFEDFEVYSRISRFIQGFRGLFEAPILLKIGIRDA